MRQVKCNNQVMDKKNYILQVIEDAGRVFCSYFKYEEVKLLFNTDLGAKKLFLVENRWKNP